MSFRGRLFRRLLLHIVAWSAVVLIVGLFLLNRAIQRIDADRTKASHEALVRQLGRLVEGRLDADYRVELARIVSAFAVPGDDGMRVTIIDLDGIVLADSEASPMHMDNHSDRPEVKAALQNGIGMSTRWSDTVARYLNYTALRLGPSGHPEGIARIALASYPTGTASESAGAIDWKAGLLSLLAIALGAAVISAHWNDRVQWATQTIRRLLRGEIIPKPAESRYDELDALERLAGRLVRRQTRLRDADRHERQMLEAILTHLGEGIVVVSPDGRILLTNSTARQMLDIKDEMASPLYAGEAWTVERRIGNHELQCLLLDPLNNNSEENSTGTEIQIEANEQTGTRTLLAQTTTIELFAGTARKNRPDSGVGVATESPASSTGRLLVLSDITALTQSVRIKTDFVSHASHELRTPLAAIRGAVETLLQMNLVEGDAAAPRFLEIVRRHARRLEDLATDLLALARLESGSRRFKSAAIIPQQLLQELHDRWDEPVAAAGLQWKIDLPDGGTGFSANAHLLHLMLDNLIENAVKFTPPNGRIDVRFELQGSDLVLTVRDNGCGIPHSEQQRVFERFYQVEPVRSPTGHGTGAPRGTGLGLSIVRHAVAAMSGDLSLNSEVGKGTTITVRLPQKPKPDTKV